MADLVVRDGIGYKRRNPWGTFFLSLVTLGVYAFVWWYKVNNELRNYGIPCDPVASLFGIIFFASLSAYGGAYRILWAQTSSSASERISPPLSVFLSFFGLFALPYYQSQLNKVWDALAAQGAEVTPA